MKRPSMWVLGALLLQVTLASADVPSCSASGNDGRPVITCGAPGLDGVPGPNGINGNQGLKGDQGLLGIPGIPGAAGKPGGAGPPGVKGYRGPSGLPGPVGPSGDPGVPGLNGAKGDAATLDMDAINAQMAILVGQVNTLQSSLDQQRKVLNFYKKSIRIGSKLFTAPGVQGDYTQAMAFCVKAGGRLAMPRNPSENDAILSIRNYHGVNAYLGVNSLLTTGVFRYLTGEALTYTNWGPSEPNNLVSELCVDMSSDGTWSNRRCEGTALIVCEF